MGGFPGENGGVFRGGNEGVVNGEEGLEGYLTGLETKSPNLRFE